MVLKYSTMRDVSRTYFFYTVRFDRTRWKCKQTDNRPDHEIVRWCPIVVEMNRLIDWMFLFVTNYIALRIVKKIWVDKWRNILSLLEGDCTKVKCLGTSVSFVFQPCSSCVCMAVSLWRMGYVNEFIRYRGIPP